MAFVTLCPQCQTGFAVQPEHFSTADGWVRCGQCAHVFQLDQHLFEMDDPRPMPELVQPLSRPVPALETSALQTNHHPGVIALVALLLLTLVMQWAVHDRHALVGRVPEAMPLMEAVCRVLSCEVHLPMDPDQVALESSSFKRTGQHTFVFEGMVKNLSDSFLYPPALELSLNDDSRVVVRRVITPQELGMSEPLRPHGSHAFFLRFGLDPALSPTVDGYKALLFYP